VARRLRIRVPVARLIFAKSQPDWVAIAAFLSFFFVKKLVGSFKFGRADGQYAPVRAVCRPPIFVHDIERQ